MRRGLGVGAFVLMTLAFLVSQNQLARRVSPETIRARVPAAMTQCEQFTDRSARTQCLAWTISTGEDL